MTWEYKRTYLYIQVDHSHLWCKLLTVSGHKNLQQLSEDEGAAFLLTAEVLRNQIFVDDIISGSSSIEKASIIKSQLISLIKCGSFEL